MGFEHRGLQVVGRINATTQAREAILLRQKGLTYAAIAEQLGISESSARRCVNIALRQLVTPDAETLRHLEASRLDAVQNAIWDRCIDGDLRSIDRFLRISERRSKLLGLDRPASEEDENDRPKTTIIEILPRGPEAGAEPPSGGALAASGAGVAEQEPRDRAGRGDGSGEDVAGPAVDVQPAP